MSRIIMTGALVGLLGVSAVEAATLDISIAAQTNYANMVADTKLRGDGGLEDWNLGAALGGSMRMYANFLGDGTTPSGRLNNFLQRFDVSSIPPGATINSATLTTYFANQTANDRTWTNVNLSRLRPGKDWIETFQEIPGTNGPHFDGSVTWNNQVSSETSPVPWEVAGATGAADIDMATTQTFDLIGVAGSATTIVRDITSWVQDWVNTPTNNTGMVWWGGNHDESASGNRYFLLGVKEDGEGPADDTVAAAPTLVIVYNSSGTNAGPNITSIQFVSGNVQIDFTSDPGDMANLFTLQSSGTVTGTYNDVSATITQEGPPGSFRAVIAPSGDIQFYRIKR